MSPQSDQLEHIPERLIDNDMAAANGTTACDIVHNRKADHAAKPAALQVCPIFHTMFDQLCQVVLQRQEWPTSLCHLIGMTVPPKDDEPDSDQDEAQIAPHEQFPRLPWKANLASYRWTLKEDWPPTPVPPTQLAESDWQAVGHFFRQFHWKIADDCVISHAELALLFYYQGFKCAELVTSEHFTFQALIVWFKKCLKICRKHVSFAIFPGENDSRLHNSWGKTMPAGAIVKAAPFLPDDFFDFLANVSRHVVKANLDTWSFLVSSFPR